MEGSGGGRIQGIEGRERERKTNLFFDSKINHSRRHHTLVLPWLSSEDLTGHPLQWAGKIGGNGGHVVHAFPLLS